MTAKVSVVTTLSADMINVKPRSSTPYSFKNTNLERIALAMYCVRVDVVGKESVEMVINVLTLTILNITYLTTALITHTAIVIAVSNINVGHLKFVNRNLQ